MLNLFSMGIKLTWWEKKKPISFGFNGCKWINMQLNETNIVNQFKQEIKFSYVVPGETPSQAVWGFAHIKWWRWGVVGSSVRFRPKLLWSKLKSGFCLRMGMFGVKKSKKVSAVGTVGSSGRPIRRLHEAAICGPICTTETIIPDWLHILFPSICIHLSVLHLSEHQPLFNTPCYVYSGPHHWY